MPLELQPIEDVKAWLGIEAADTEFDASLTLIKDSVEETILEYVQTSFEPTVVAGELHDTNRGDGIVPRYFPVKSVEGLTFGIKSDGSGGTPLSAADIQNLVVVRKESISLRGYNPHRMRGGVLIDYTYGYDSVPARVKMAVNLSVEAFWNRKQRGSVGIASRSKEGESESYGGGGTNGPWDLTTGLPNEAMALLAEYRRIEFPDSPYAESYV